MSLRDYRRKRDFGETPEPSADVSMRDKRTKQPIFVVQLHHARARHYDFRLEVDGTLKSWAVPKGPSLRPGDRRLAVEVEDHPLAYADFAGDIPAGQYGAGHVDIVDNGTWTPLGEPLAALAKGHLDFELHGRKLRGRWTLVRTRIAGGKQNWLLLKRTDAEARDAEADDLVDAKLRRSGNPPLGAATHGKKAVNERAKPRRAAATWRKRALALDGARDRPLRAGFAPEFCALADECPRGDGWLHETKWDGYRLLADLEAGRAHLRSRNDIDWTDRLPGIVRAIESLPVASARLDGELVATDARGRSDFSALQRALQSENDAALHHVLFDLPALEGIDLTRVALVERKALLESLLAKAREPTLLYSTHVEGDGTAVFDAAVRHGLEGIVSKRADSSYVGGRGRDWLKIKHAQSDEFAVIGYTAPKGSRGGFGSLLLARVDDGAWRYVGRVGSGFDDARIASLHRLLLELARNEAVVALPSHVPFRARDVHWVEPRLVVEVAFRGLAKEGLLRQASFLRLRDDKQPGDLGMATRRTEKTTSRPAARPTRDTRGAVVITHPERIVFPDTSINKQDVAHYYHAVADWLLPELARRPLSILRCPDGAEAACFFQKHHAGALGPHVASIRLAEKSGASDDYFYVTAIAGVLELVQMNAIELHPWGARIDAPDKPDRLVFDLDPAPGVVWKEVIAAARDVRARLAEVGLESYARLSGGKGVHVVVPIARRVEWSEAKTFCAAFAEAMVASRPMAYIATASKARREGRIFIDWLRNARGATSIANWSLRARPGAPVAMPIGWDELGRTRAGDDFDLFRALRRAKALRKDPWPGFATKRQTLPLGASKVRNVKG